MINGQTQEQRLLTILQDKDWHCTSEMYASYMSDPRTLICKLKKVKNLMNQPAYQFNWRWCENPNHHHDGNSKEWRLL